MKTHICIDCNKEKPLSDYYVYPNGHHHTKCKKCHITYVNSRARKIGNSPHLHEIECLNYLHRHGIPTMEGKYLKQDEYKRVDLVSFGCIRVEVKQANAENKIWFSVRQRESFRSDVVIVRTVQNTYHIFPPDFHEFIRKSTGMRYVATKISDLSLSIYADNINFVYDVLTQKSVTLEQKSNI